MADIRSFFKKPRLSEPARPLRDPRSIVTWNANGLAPRIAHDLAALREFVTEHDPDVLLVQEARLRAHCDNPRAKADSAAATRDMAASLSAIALAARSSADLILWLISAVASLVACAPLAAACRALRSTSDTVPPRSASSAA